MQGYAERKLIFLHQLILACRNYHSIAVRQQKLGVAQQLPECSTHAKLITNKGISSTIERDEDVVDSLPATNDKLENNSAFKSNAPLETPQCSKNQKDQRSVTPPHQARSLPEGLIYAEIKPNNRELLSAPIPQELRGGEAATAGAGPRCLTFYLEVSPINQFGLAEEESCSESDKYCAYVASNEAIRRGEAPLSSYESVNLNRHTINPQSNHEISGLNGIQDASLDIEHLYSCIHRLELGVSSAKMDSYALRNATQAHLSLLESRILTLEQRPANGLTTASTTNRKNSCGPSHPSFHAYEFSLTSIEGAKNQDIIRSRKVLESNDTLASSYQPTEQGGSVSDFDMANSILQRSVVCFEGPSNHPSAMERTPVASTKVIGRHSMGYSTPNNTSNAREIDARGSHVSGIYNNSVFEVQRGSQSGVNIPTQYCTKGGMGAAAVLRSLQDRLVEAQAAIEDARMCV